MSAHTKRKVLLTGAGGTLGRAIRALAGPEIEWVCLDIATGDDPAIHPGSFTEEALLDRLLPGCEAVIHTAALHGGNRATHTPTQFTEVNVAGLITLLEAGKRHGVKRFVFSSSMEVLIGVDWTASGLAVVDEYTTPNPDWIYPVNKLLGEQIGLYYHLHHDLEFVALRYMWFDAVMGPTPRLLSRYIMPLDVAAANLRALIRPDIGYEVLNIGPETPLMRHDIIEALSDPYAVVERYWPGASQVLRDKDIPLETHYFWPVTRIDRARRILDWRPETTFETYLQSLGWQKP